MSEAHAASCEGKVRFDSFAAGARIQKRRDGRRKTSGQRVYRCRFCHGWHIGQEGAERQKHEWRRFVERYT